MNSFNLTLPKGITGVVGPNGAGKSTLFKIAMSMIKPSQGKLWVMGEDPWLNDELLSRIGFCPDYDSLADDYTGEEFLEYIGGLHGMKGTSLRGRISEVVSLVGMEDAVKRKIGGYSKGMRQRIKIAGTILHDPDLLLLDEPLSGADPGSRKSLIELIKRLNEKEGHHVIVSSHVLFEIERMTRNIALIYKGRAVASGDISEIRDLIDEHPHNIIIQGSRLVELAKELIERDYTVSVGFEKDRSRLKVEVSEPDQFFDSLPMLVSEVGSDIEQLYSQDEGLEAVFKYLVMG